MKKIFILSILVLMMVGCSSSSKKLVQFNQSRSLKLSEIVIVKDNMFFSDMQSSVRGGIGSLMGDIIANGMDSDILLHLAYENSLRRGLLGK